MVRAGCVRNAIESGTLQYIGEPTLLPFSHSVTEPCVKVHLADERHGSRWEFLDHRIQRSGRADYGIDRQRADGLQSESRKQWTVQSRADTFD